MNRGLERRKNLIGSLTFIIFVLVLVVGGFFLTRYLTDDSQIKTIRKKENNSFKVEKDKDFVYFENEDPVSQDPGIVYKDIIINIQGANTINELLNEKMKSLRASVKKISESEVDKSREILYSEDDIFYALERDYNVYESSNYLSILITDSEFNCYTGSEIKEVSTYNFSLTNGKLLSNETLIGYKKITIDEIKEKVRNKLVKDQEEFGDNNQINIDETVNSITLDKAALYINKYGKLVISVVVKTAQENYNDTIELV